MTGEPLLEIASKDETDVMNRSPAFGLGCLNQLTSMMDIL